MNDFVNGNKSKWKWTLMIMQPEEINSKIIESAIEEVAKKKNLEPLNRIKLEKFSEGKSVQMMHIGPFSEEHENIIKIHNMIKENKGKFDGKETKAP
jgi:hypothetical protein